jgi:hypothetical protein
LLGDGQVLRLPGRASHALAAHRLDRRFDRVGANNPHPVRKLQAGHRHPQADDRRQQRLGLVGVTAFGVESRQRRLQALAVEGEAGSALPKFGKEGDQHLLGARPRVGRHGLAPLLQVRGGDASFHRRLPGGSKAGQGAQLVAMLGDIAPGHRHVAVEGRVVAALGGDVERDLLPHRDHRAEPRRGLGREALDRFVQEEITHDPGFRP